MLPERMPPGEMSRFTRRPMTCPEHPHITLSCAACVGRRGGQAKSRRKREAARANGRKGGCPRAKRDDMARRVGAGG
jgi:hypothetical protein